MGSKRRVSSVDSSKFWTAPNHPARKNQQRGLLQTPVGFFKMPAFPFESAIRVWSSEVMIPHCQISRGSPRNKQPFDLLNKRRLLLERIVRHCLQTNERVMSASKDHQPLPPSTTHDCWQNHKMMVSSSVGKTFMLTGGVMLVGQSSKNFLMVCVCM